MILYSPCHTCSSPMHMACVPQARNDEPRITFGNHICLSCTTAIHRLTHVVAYGKIEFRCLRCSGVNAKQYERMRN